MESGDSSVEISPHGLARQPTKRRYLRKTRVQHNPEEGDRQVSRLDGQPQPQPREGDKLSGSLVDELRLHFDFESLKEG